MMAVNKMSPAVTPGSLSFSGLSTLFRGCLITYVKTQAKKSEMDLYLRKRSIAVAM
jgi:hypothetical protein